MHLLKYAAFLSVFLFCAPIFAGDPCIGAFESYPVAEGDAHNRFHAMALHKKIMNSPVKDRIPTGWDGDIDTCTVGNLSKEFRQYSTQWLNYLRFISGLRQVVFSCSAGEKVQAAALMMAANKRINHYPPRTWLCFSEDGRYAAEKSNLFGSTGEINTRPSAVINTWFRSPGHRAGLLSPFLYNYALGVANSPNSWYAVAKVIGTSDQNNPPDPVPVLSWPPAGLYVYEDILNPKDGVPKYAYKHLIYKAENIKLATASATFEINGERIPLQVTHPKVTGGKRLGFILDQSIASAAFTRIFKETYAARVKVTIIPAVGNPLPYEMVWISRAGVDIKPVGEMLKQQVSTLQWTSIPVQASFDDPVMYLQSQTYNAQKPTVVIGTHTPKLAISLRGTSANTDSSEEHIQVLLVEAGEHTIEGGLHVKAQHVNVPPQGILVSYQGFSNSRPMVLTQIVSPDLNGAYIVQAIAEPSLQSYQISVHGLNGAPSLASVPVDMIMVEKKGTPIKGAQYTINTFDRSLSTSSEKIPLPSDFSTPYLLGTIFAKEGPNPAIIRLAELTNNEGTVFFDMGNPGGPSLNTIADYLHVSAELPDVFLYPKPPMAARSE